MPVCFNWQYWMGGVMYVTSIKITQVEWRGQKVMNYMYVGEVAVSL